MAYVLGIDIGTSFTAAAVARQDGATPDSPQVLGLGTRQTAVPSVIFLGDDGQVLVGEAAERRAMTRPECVVRAFKRRVGDSIPIMAGTGSIAPTDALALMARWVVDQAQEREGAPPEFVALTHPAGWGEHKLGLVRESLAGVGLADVILVNEPEAAARHYAAQERVEAGSTVAVYDLGGGTFDAAILRKAGPDSFELLGRPEGIEQLGGADFDDAVFRHVATSQGTTFAELDPSDPDVLMALARVRRECTEAKEALSFDAEASIPVLLPGQQTRIRLVRQEFETLIEGRVRQSLDALDRSLQAAHVTPGDLTAILLVGGSSRVPLVAQLLSAEFDRPIAADVDPKASVCLGAARSAAVRLPLPDSNAGVGRGDEHTPEPVLAAPGPQPVRPRPSSRPGLAASVSAAGAADPRAGARRRVRVTAVAATLATVTVLTATAAQTPSGLDFSAPRAAAAQAGALVDGLLAPDWRPPAQDVSARKDANGVGLVAAPGLPLPGVPEDAASSEDPRTDPAASDAPGAVPEPGEATPTAPGTDRPASGASPNATRASTGNPAPGTPSPVAPRAAGPTTPVTGPGPEGSAPSREPQPTRPVTPSPVRPPVQPPATGSAPETTPATPGPAPETTLPTPDPAPPTASPVPASSAASAVPDETEPAPALLTDPPTTQGV